MPSLYHFTSTNGLPNPQTLDTLRLLLVEDKLNDAALEIWQLRKAGFLVSADVVDSLDRFEEAIQANRYDLVLADFKLSGFTGMDVLAKLKKRAADVPLIVVTGATGEDLAVDCMKQGAADYVLKDRPETLTRAVRLALDEREKRERDRVSEEERRKAQEVSDRNRELALAETLRRAKEAAEAASRATRYVLR
jgi:DNA-binding NtrC family response regulator